MPCYAKVKTPVMPRVLVLLPWLGCIPEAQLGGGYSTVNSV